MIEVAYTNIHSKTKIKMVSYLILLPLYDEFAWGVLILLYITVTEVHASSIDADTRYFGNFVLDNLNWDKISHSLTKKSQYLEQSATLFEMKKKIKNCEPNSLIQSLVSRLNISYSEIYQKGNWKKAQLSICKCGLGILEIDTQLSSLGLKLIKTNL